MHFSKLFMAWPNPAATSRGPTTASCQGAVHALKHIVDKENTETKVAQAFGRLWARVFVLANPLAKPLDVPKAI